jgi:hypothetical protein
MAAFATAGEKVQGLWRMSTALKLIFHAPAWPLASSTRVAAAVNRCGAA